MFEYVGNGVNDGAADEEQGAIETVEWDVRQEPPLSPREHEEDDQDRVNPQQPVRRVKSWNPCLHHPLLERWPSAAARKRRTQQGMVRLVSICL